MFRQHETIGAYQGTHKFQNRYIPNFPQQHPFNSMQQENNFTTRMPQQNNEQHWCETCDRGFPSLPLLTKHKQEHKMCNIDGCKFVAHPKVITKHIQMQHASGVFKKIAKLNNPEEIKKWLEERKKKYPTKVNMEKKAAEIKEKIERGERMGLKQIGYGKSHKTDIGAKRKADFGCENLQQKRLKKYGKNVSASSVHKKTVLPKKVHSKVPTVDESRKLKPFTGIQGIVMVDDNYENNIVEEINCNFDIVDDDDEPTQLGDKENNNCKPSICGALSSLIGNYGSSEDELEDIEVNSRCKTIPPLEKETKEPLVSKPFKEDKIKNSYCNYDKSEDDSGPEEIQNAKQLETLESETKTVQSTKCTKRLGPNQNKFKHKINKPKPKVPSTLLQKLLHKEIQQERNIVLQCIRHIVKNNFYDKN